MSHNSTDLQQLLPHSYRFAQTLRASLSLGNFLGNKGSKRQLTIGLPSSIDACDRTSLLLSIANELPAAEFTVERTPTSNHMRVCATFS
jgi:hypothetical protein